MGQSEDDKRALVAALEAHVGLRSRGQDAKKQSVALVGAAASIMIRRRFSAGDRRLVTSYVMGLFVQEGDESLEKCRIAETVVRSELGELELVEDLPSIDLAFEIASAVLKDLVRESGFDSRRIELLVQEADVAASAFRGFAQKNRISMRGLLRRAVRRRAGGVLGEG